MSLHKALMAAFPDAKDKDWLLQDDSDGKGPYIREWNRPETKPTKAQLAAMVAAYVPPEPTKAEKLAATDAGMIRVYEDVVSALIAKGVVSVSDLPDAARRKWQERVALRVSR